MWLVGSLVHRLPPPTGGTAVKKWEGAWAPKSRAWPRCRQSIDRGINEHGQAAAEDGIAHTDTCSDVSSVQIARFQNSMAAPYIYTFSVARQRRQRR